MPTSQTSMPSQLSVPTPAKYTVGDIVFSSCGFDGILGQYRVINSRFLNKHDLDDEIAFNYEWENAEQIKKDPYIYTLEYCEDNICIDPDDTQIFRTKYVLSNLITCKK